MTRSGVSLRTRVTYTYAWKQDGLPRADLDWLTLLGYPPGSATVS